MPEMTSLNFVVDLPTHGVKEFCAMPAVLPEAWKPSLQAAATVVSKLRVRLVPSDVRSNEMESGRTIEALTSANLLGGVNFDTSRWHPRHEIHKATVKNPPT
jgi:hypothetical protein